jgi:hypothetical protein
MSLFALFTEQKQKQKKLSEEDFSHLEKMILRIQAYNCTQFYFWDCS